MSDDYSANLPHDQGQPVAVRAGQSRLRRILALVAFVAIMLLMAEMLRMGAKPHPHAPPGHAIG